MLNNGTSKDQLESTPNSRIQPSQTSRCAYYLYSFTLGAPQCPLVPITTCQHPIVSVSSSQQMLATIRKSQVQLGAAWLRLVFDWSLQSKIGDSLFKYVLLKLFLFKLGEELLFSYSKTVKVQRSCGFIDQKMTSVRRTLMDIYMYVYVYHRINARSKELSQQTLGNKTQLNANG